MAQRPGVPNIFRPDMARNLSRIFPPERGGFELPNVLSGGVQLVHDFLSTIAYAAVSIYDLLGAADAISITTAVAVPEGFCWCVEQLNVNTDDNTSRILTAWLHYINSAGDFALAVGNVASVTGANPSFQIIPGGRFIMPPQAKLEVTAPALTAGKKIRLTMAYLQMPLGQFAPRS